MARCESYFQHGLVYRCYSIRSPKECSCGGDTSKCDFFPEKRKPKVPELKPCPFCGGFAIYLEQRAFSRFGSGLDRFVAVQCYDCGSRTEGVRINGVESLAEQKEMAAEAWNRRAGDA